MATYPKSLRNLIECFKKLPSVGEKSAERMALSIMEMKEEQINLFSESLIDVKTKIKRCNICNNFTEEDICEICSDSGRNNEVICVVEVVNDEVYSGNVEVVNDEIFSENVDVVENNEVRVNEQEAENIIE